ncbi:zinc-binding alcohol dehydrogenase family protein [Legionella fairfieldensis]|uniref:zinc-binding alcohol dehydrogenase family protein n=1 Tax=Legionella fairfieldensis TaxID=45064 RepID=UPI00048EC12B|nr:zinc-binding alcohol dehydrogenase family protein [Legionella fairfieldensis]
MKAVGCKQARSMEEGNLIIDMELPTPQATGHDILVEIKAIAVNPIDYKVRLRTRLQENQYRIVGWDAAGIVKETGENVTLFKPGDEVWYSGDLMRPGCNSEFQLVDERIVSLKPKSLSFEQAAALPLTTLTAWELLFDRLNVTSKTQALLLVVGAGGGVGSILVQLARQLTQLTIIGTASRDESRQWVKDNGAHYIIDHTQPLFQQLTDLDIGEVDYVACLTHSEDHAPELAKCLKPQGKLGLIDDPARFDIRLFKLKSISLHWESMFTRSFYKTEDMIKQHQILKKVAKLVDQGVIQTTINENFGLINAQNLNLAHSSLLNEHTRGKIVLSGFY